METIQNIKQHKVTTRVTTLVTTLVTTFLRESDHFDYFAGIYLLYNYYYLKGYKYPHIRQCIGRGSSHSSHFVGGK